MGTRMDLCSPVIVIRFDAVPIMRDENRESKYIWPKTASEHQQMRFDRSAEGMTRESGVRQQTHSSERVRTWQIHFEWPTKPVVASRPF